MIDLIFAIDNVWVALIDPAEDNMHLTLMVEGICLTSLERLLKINYLKKP